MILDNRQIDYSQLFELEDPLANRPLRLSPKSVWLHKNDANQLFYGRWQPPEPVLFEGYMGGSIADFLWSGLTPLVCISERVVNLLLDNRFTGWATYPVEVYDRKGVHLPGYYGFAVKSYAGERDYERSEIVTKPPPTPAGKFYDVYKGIYFDESKWDGSEIFRVQHAIIIVTSRVQVAFKKAKVNNIRFTPAMESEIRVSTVNIIKEVE
jgi:hypothetical protein